MKKQKQMPLLLKMLIFIAVFAAIGFLYFMWKENNF